MAHYYTLTESMACQNDFSSLTLLLLFQRFVWFFGKLWPEVILWQDVADYSCHKRRCLCKHLFTTTWSWVLHTFNFSFFYLFFFAFDHWTTFSYVCFSFSFWYFLFNILTLLSVAHFSLLILHLLSFHWYFLPYQPTLAADCEVWTRMWVWKKLFFLFLPPP